MRALRADRPVLLLALLALLAGCAGRVKQEGGVARPWGRDFLDFPHKYRGLLVRLPELQVARAERVRPLVFTPPGARHEEIVVGDARALASRARLAPGHLVTIVIQCTEGRRDRGNLLVAVERASAEGAGDAPAPGDGAAAAPP